MEGGADLIDLSFGSESSTPKGKTAACGVPLSPNTAERIITRLSETVDELMEFQRAEYDTNKEHVGESDSLRRDLESANAIIGDCRIEITSLQNEVKKEKEALAQQQKEYELKLFRIQKELDQKNLEIVDLRKDKSEFDYRMKLFESRHARKIEELTQALKDARGTDLHVEVNQTSDTILKAEIEDSKAQIDNLMELLAIQTARADQLSAAFTDAITSLAEDVADIEQVLTDCNIHECLTFDESELPKFDESTIMPMLRFDQFEFSSLKSLDDEEINEIIAPAREAISGAMAWARELLNLWSHERIEAFTLEKEQLDNNIEQACTYEFEQRAVDQDNSLKMMDEVQIKNESGMTTYMSAAEDFVETVLTPENTLEDFAKEFADYLVENQVFHPDDVPPRDPNVFHFLLDRYLFLIETYDNARTEFAEKVKELEEEHKVHVAKTETLFSQISQLEISDSTLCDTSVTEGSLDLQRAVWSCDTVADDSICATMLADATRDPLEMTMEKIKNTPEQQKARTGFQTPQSRIPLGRSTPATKSKSRPSFIPSTPRIDEEPSMTQNPASIIKTPLQRILRDEVCSTAKKSVTFKSPLLARVEIETENARLKAMLAEKLDAIRAIEYSVQVRIDSVEQLEERVEQLESTAVSATKSLERAEAEYSEKREALEKELAQVSGQLRELTNKLTVEAINLDPSLEMRLRNQAPTYVLTQLLDTIITTFQKAQDDDKLAFEKERQEHSAEMLQFAGTTESLQMKIDQLTGELAELFKDAERRQLEQAELEDKISALEEDVLRLTSDNRDLERDNAQLNKEYREIKLKMSDAEGTHLKIMESDKEIESLKLALEAAETEKSALKSENAEKNSQLSQLEQNLSALKTELEQIKLKMSDDEQTLMKITESEKAIESLKLALEAAETEKNLLKLENAEKNSQLSQLEQDLSALKTELEQIKLKMSDDEQTLMKITESEKAIESLKLALEAAETEKNVLKSENAEKSSQLGQLEIDLSALKTELEQIKLKISNDEETLLKFVDSAKEVESLKLALEAAETEKNVLKSETAEKNSQLDQLLQDLTALKTEMDKIKTEKTALDANLQSAHDLVDEIGRSVLGGDNNEASTILEKIQFVKNLVEKRVAVLNSENKILNKIAQSHEAELAVLTQEMIVVKAALLKTEEKIIQLEHEVTGLEQARNELKEQNLKLLTEISATKDEAILALKQEAIQLAAEYDACKTELTNLKLKSEADLAEKLAIIEKLENDVQSNLEKITQQDTLITVLEGKLSQLQDDKDKEIVGQVMLREKAIEELTQLRHETEAKNEEIETVKREYLTVIDGLNASIREKEASLAEMHADVENLKLEADKQALSQLHIDSLKEEMNSMAQQLNNTLKEKSSIAESLAVVQSQLSDALSRFHSVESELEGLKTELTQKQESIESLIAAKTDLDEKLKATEQALNDKSAIADKLPEVEGNLLRVEGLVTDLEAANEQLRAKNAALGEEFDKEKHDWLLKGDEASALKTELGCLQSELNKKLELINSLTAAKNELVEQLSHKTAISEKLSEIEQVKSDLQRLTQQLTDSETCYENLKAEFETLGEQSKSEKQDLVSNLDCLRGELNEAKETVNSLNAAKDELCEKLSQAEQNFKTGTDELIAEKSAIVGKLSETEEAYNQAKSDLQRITLELTDSEACVEKLKAEIETLCQQTGKEKTDLSNEMDCLRRELSDKEKLVNTLTDSNNELVEKLTQAEQIFATGTEKLVAEKTAITEKLSETEEAYKLASEQHGVLKAELDSVVDSLTAAKNELAGKLLETEQVLIETKNELTAKKTVLAEQLSEIEQAYSAAKSDLQRMERMLADLEAANEKLRLENASVVDKLAKEKQDLMDANALITDLENQLGQFKLTEGAILRKLADKQASDEAAMRLRAELTDLKASWDQQQTELENLRQSVQQTESASNQEVERLNTSLEKNRSTVKDLETQMNDLNQKVEELTANNTELCSVLEEIQQVLRLPEDAVKNLTMDTNTKSCLRMFRENVNRELNGLWTEREAMMNEKQRLTIEVEKLTSEKVQFEIKTAELDAFGKSQEEQIHALSGKLARLEASMSRRSRRSDPIGPRRLEKLEEMNKTLHDLIVGVINALQMPNAEKMRLISQREIDSAAKQILDHTAKIANSCNTLKEQIKTLDQENQELSDNMEKLLKDNSRLEMKVLEAQKSSSKNCTVCADLKASLLAKTDRLTKIETEVDELKTKITELDQENEELSGSVEALLKDNSKLEMQILDMNQNVSAKDCASCKKLKKKISSFENEVKSLNLKADDHATSLEKDLKMLREKCVELEASLKDKEEQLLRAVNNIARPDEIRMRGSSCGLTQEVTQNEKIRALTKDNTFLKELLRQRAQSIKKLEAELKRTPEEQVVMNSNSIDSPIRERKSGGLRTRGDVAAAYKRALRPGKSQGIENIY